MKKNRILWNKNQMLGRMFDANLNRTREGLRVIEDYLRFYLNEGRLAHRVRGWRQFLSREFADFYLPLLALRSIKEDSGRNFSSQRYKKPGELLMANFRRCGEALRVLEELSRLLSPAPAKKKDFHRLRYGLYQLEKEVFIYTAHRP